MANVLSKYMEKYSGISGKNKPASIRSSKRQRRAEIAKIVRQLENVRDSEENYQERIPENLQSSEVYENAERWVNILTEIIEMLEGLP